MYQKIPSRTHFPPRPLSLKEGSSRFYPCAAWAGPFLTNLSGFCPQFHGPRMALVEPNWNGYELFTVMAVLVQHSLNLPVSEKCFDTVISGTSSAEGRKNHLIRLLTILTTVIKLPEYELSPPKFPLEPAFNSCRYLLSRVANSTAPKLKI